MTYLRKWCQPLSISNSTMNDHFSLTEIANVAIGNGTLAITDDSERKKALIFAIQS